MKPRHRDKQGKRHPGVEAVVQGSIAFAFDLYGELRKEEGNLFFSPYSISTALAMTYAGARGDTEGQIAQTLRFALDQKRLHPAFASLEARLNAIQEKGGIRLEVANALWPQKSYPFLGEYLALMEEYYGVPITPVDYGEPEAARQTINAWTEEKTEAKIKDLIPRGLLDALTRLVLANAIYFKGNWASRFDQSLTMDASFWVTPDEKVHVPTMTQKQSFRYAESDGLQVLELPYVGEDLSMIVLLPREIGGLAELEKTLSAESLEGRTRHLQETEVVVYLPKFEMTSQFKLNDTLISMGMVDAFDESKANFSGMDGREEWLYIAAAIHKAFVEVNEEGTEAAAATAVVMKARGLPVLRATFQADHPFVFLIRENSTGSILFLGRVVNPTSGAA